MFCLLTPQSSHFCAVEELEKKQTGQAQTPPLVVDPTVVVVVVEVVDIFSSWRMIFGDERKKPA